MKTFTKRSPVPAGDGAPASQLAGPSAGCRRSEMELMQYRSNTYRPFGLVGGFWQVRIGLGDKEGDHAPQECPVGPASDWRSEISARPWHKP